MASGENPFSAMVDVIREEVRRGAGPSWNMGEVISVSPLKVRYRGVQLNADQVAAAGQWAAQLKVGDSVPVLPDRDDGRFAIMQPADSAAFASAEHNHDALYAGLEHNHDSDYAALGHDHDSDYAALGHNHDSDYAALGHDHDSDYLSLSGGTMAGNITMTGYNLSGGGRRASAYSTGNCNSITEEWVVAYSACTNLPVANTYWYINTIQFSTNMLKQIAHGYNANNEIYVRRCVNGTWSAWQKVF